MKITTDSSKGFALFQDGDQPSGNFNVEMKANLGNLSYSLIRSLAELTFFESGRRMSSAKIDDITVNGVQLTIDNFSETLNALFKSASGITPAPEAKYIGDGLVQHYDAIDRGNNPAIWKDLSGTNDATIENAVWLGKSLQFNGNARVSFRGDITPDYTLMGVFKRYASQGAHPRFTGESFASNSSYPYYYLASNTNNYGILGHGIDIAFSPAKSMPPNVFLHLAWRYNSTTKVTEAFENGIKVGERTGTVDATPSPLVYLGGRTDSISGTRFFNGEICNYMVYDRALTEEEMVNNFTVDNKYLTLN